MQNPRSILITGASSGIGRALALAYAEPGRTLFLGGRNAERLAAVAAECRAKGALVETRVGDVGDEAAMKTWIEDAHQMAALDLVIANAGVSLGYSRDYDLAPHTRTTFAANVDGVFNTVHPAIRCMTGRGGQIAIMSSLSGFHGLPSSPAYSASKAAVKSYGEALRGLLAKEGVSVSVICPGFIESHMTARNDFPMPFLMSSDRAAQIIVRGLARAKARIAFPFPMLAMVRLLALLPAAWSDLLLRRAPRKR
ncbi:MAG: short-chain dehydrogenase [Proteobacteria bacterium]|nr:MAG: short-chain dehydrogenase [Pseudomonadota bacterium]